MPNTKSKIDLFLDLKHSVYPAFSVLAGVQLDLFTALKDGPRTAVEIAESLGINAQKLAALLYILVAGNYLSVTEERFSNSPVVEEFLVRGSPQYAGDLIKTLPDWWNPILKTAESIRTGVAQVKMDYANAVPDELEAHYQAFYQLSLATGNALLGRFDFKPYRNLLDVGGGTGGVAIAIAAAHPHLRATIADFPAVISATQRFIDESTVADRVSAVGVDVTHESLSETFDVAIMSAFMPVLGPDSIRRALKTTNKCLKPGGKLYVTDAGMLDDTRLSPDDALNTNLNFINLFDEGEAHPVGKRREWLAEAGFEVIEQDLLPNQWGVLIAQKSSEPHG